MSYLARTPCVPLFSIVFNRGGNRRAFRLPGLGVPPWSLSLSKDYRDFELSFLGILVFRGTFGPTRPNLDPVSTNSGLFQPVLSGGPDLFSPISTYFAGWT